MVDKEKTEDSFWKGVKIAAGIIFVIAIFFWLFQPRLEVKIQSGNEFTPVNACN